MLRVRLFFTIYCGSESTVSSIQRTLEWNVIGDPGGDRVYGRCDWLFSVAAGQTPDTVVECDEPCLVWEEWLAITAARLGEDRLCWAGACSWSVT